MLPYLRWRLSWMLLRTSSSMLVKRLRYQYSEAWSELLIRDLPPLDRSGAGARFAKCLAWSDFRSSPAFFWVSERSMRRSLID